MISPAQIVSGLRTDSDTGRRKSTQALFPEQAANGDIVIVSGDDEIVCPLTVDPAWARALCGEPRRMS